MDRNCGWENIILVNQGRNLESIVVNVRIICTGWTANFKDDPLGIMCCIKMENCMLGPNVDINAWIFIFIFYAIKYFVLLHYKKKNFENSVITFFYTKSIANFLNHSIPNTILLWKSIYYLISNTMFERDWERAVIDIWGSIFSSLFTSSLTTNLKLFLKFS
jgi:hypothetical protein